MKEGEDQKNEFQRADAAAGSGILREFMDFLIQSKKWWMIPIFIILILIGFLVILGKTSIAPFIYTLF